MLGRERHFGEADVEADCSGHQEVVVVAGDGTVGAVGLALVGEVFVEDAGVSFDIGMLTDILDEGCDDEGFCRDIGMEAIFAGESLADVLVGLAAGVEVGVNVADLMEDVERLVAVDGTVAVVGLKGIGLDDEERLIVESGNLGGFPSEEVDVDVATPLSDDGGTAAVDHSDAVEYSDNGPVGLVGSAADVDDGKIAVRDDELGVRRIR